MAGAGAGAGALAVAPRRYVLCTTPAQGHTAPLLALARRLVDEGHQVVFFTTAHYRDKVEATGAAFVPFAEEYDAHDLMVANPERESSSKRGVRGVKDDLRRIFIGPIPGQWRDLRGILDEHDPDGVVVDCMFLGALPLALGGGGADGGGAGRGRGRPVLACVGVMPYSSCSRDTAPFGVAFQPGSGPLARLRNVTMNWATEHGALADIQRFARRRLAEAGCPSGFPGYFIDLQPKVVDAYYQATVAGFEYPRSDLAPSVRFVGPILAPPSASAFDPPPWWDELGDGRPVVHVTQGTLDNADLGRLLLLSLEALAGDDVLVVGTTGGPDPEPLRRRLPANARLERFIPHDLLLPHVDAMVTNGGYGGVQQALAHGVPLVVAGDSEDKPEVAARGAVVGRRRQPAHRAPVPGHGGPGRAPRADPAGLPQARPGAAGGDRSVRSPRHHQLGAGGADGEPRRPSRARRRLRACRPSAPRRPVAGARCLLGGLVHLGRGEEHGGPRRSAPARRDGQAEGSGRDVVGHVDDHDDVGLPEGEVERLHLAAQLLDARGGGGHPSGSPLGRHPLDALEGVLHFDEILGHGNPLDSSIATIRSRRPAVTGLGPEFRLPVDR